MDFRALAIVALSILLSGGYGQAQEESCTPASVFLAEHTLLLKVAEVIGVAQNPVAPGAGFTMLAPTDEAIERFLVQAGVTMQDLLRMEDVAKEIRDFHSLIKPLLIKDFVDGAWYQTGSITSSCGANQVLAKVADDASVTLYSNYSHAKIIGPDQVACGGIVVHAIDSVLIPCPLGAAAASA